MDAIRANHAPAERSSSPLRYGTSDERVELNSRGETIVYHAGARHAYVEWTYAMGHRLYRSSLTMWHGPERGMSERMSMEEADRVFARIVALVTPILGTSDLIIVP
jgi:hypothetical protein